MFKLLRHFSILSAVAMCAATLVLVILFRNHQVAEGLRQTEAQNIAIAKSMANALWASDSKFLSDLPRPGMDSLPPSADLVGLRRKLAELTRNLPIVKIKIFAPSGLTVYSTDSSQIGEDRSQYSGFKKTLSINRPHSELKMQGSFWFTPEHAGGRDLLATYVPASRPGLPTEGIFEIYTDVTLLLADIRRATLTMGGWLITIFVMLYGALFFIVRHADRTIAEQYAVIQDNQTVMTAKNTALEEALKFQKQIDAALRESQEMLSAFIQNTPSVAFVKDMEGRFTLVNKAFLEAVGKHEMEILGKTDFDLFDEASARRFVDNDDVVIRAKVPMEFEEHITTAVGKRLFLSLKFPMTTPEGRVYAVAGIAADITERDHTERQLQDQNQFLETLIDANPAPIFFKDEQAIYLGCNKAFEDFLGLRREDIAGKSVFDLAPPDLAAIYHKADADLFESGGTQIYEAQVKAANGSIRDVIFHKACFYRAGGKLAGLIGVILDITQRKQAETVSKQLSAALEELSEIFAMYDADDRLVICNKRYRDIHAEIADTVVPGVSFEDHTRAAVERGMVLEAVGREEAWIRDRLERHRNPRGPFEITRRGGMRLLILEQRMPDGVTTIFTTDISSLKRAENALRDSEQRYRAFAADAAHELRTPLAVLKLHLDALEDSDTARQLHKDVDQMTRLVEQLLALTRLETMGVETDDRADLRAVCANVAAYLMPLALRDGREIEVSGTESPVIIRGNPQMLEQAIRNLVENALRYSSRDAPVVIEVDDDASIRIIDRGIGIPQEKRETIFQRFLRQDRRAGGAGLGLNIVQRTVDVHAGSIRIKDTPGGGATFELRFPLLGSAAPLSAAKTDKAVP